jgi:regulator of nucleoside diphosphate kinase
MNSEVTFTVLSTKKTFTYTLVYPDEATVSNKLSILTPAGSALLGLSVGEEIEWPLESNKLMKIRIDKLRR